MRRDRESSQSGTTGLWQNRNWRLLWIGQSVSFTGDMVFLVTVLLWIATIIAKGQTWAPAAASGALIATAGPVLVVGPLAGVFVDRWDRRRTMLAADAARFALIVSLLVLPLLRHHIPVGAQLAILYAVLAACSCFAEFFDPSRLAVIGATVPPEHQARANGQLQASFSMAQIVGPPIAAPLLITLGVQWALIVNAASFAVSFLCVRAISAPLAPSADAPPRASFAAEFRDGIRFFVGNRILMTIGIGLVIAMLGNGAVNSLAVFFVPHNLHVAASWLGTLVGSVGAGAIAGSLLAGAIANRLRPAMLFWISLIGCGIALIGLSRATDLVVALITGALVGLASGVLNTVFSPIILSVTPPHLIGRVSAVFSPAQQLASIVSMVLAGVLASTVLAGFHAAVGPFKFGPYDTVFAAGGLLFVIGGIASIAPLSKSAKQAPAPDMTTVPIYHIASETEWTLASDAGEYRVSTRGKTLDEQGFIHASDAHQVAGVANVIYRQDDGLVVLEIDVAKLRSEVRYEGVPDSNEQFPHIYGPLNVDAVVGVLPLARGPDGSFAFPVG